MKRYFFIFFLFFLNGILFAQGKNQLIETEVETPIVISLVNKQDGGEWVLEKTIPDLEIVEKRKGYLNTYFIFKSYKALEGNLTFSYKSAQTSSEKKIEGGGDKRIYTIKIYPKKTQLSQDSVGEKDSKKEEKIVVVSENIQKENPNIEHMKVFVEDLINEELYDEALGELNQLAEKEQGKIDKKWMIRKKIEILEKQKKYDQIVTYANSLLEEESNTGKESQKNEMDFFIRLKKAKAEYQTGKKSQALSQLIFLKNYYPNYPEIYYELADFYFQENLLAKGISMLEYLLAKFDDPPQKDAIYFRLGKYYYQTVGLNGYNLSLKYYRRVVDMGFISPYYKEAKKMVDFLEKNFINIR